MPEEGRGPGGRRHRVHHDRAEGPGPRVQAPLPLPPILYLPDKREWVKVVNTIYAPGIDRTRGTTQMEVVFKRRDLGHRELSNGIQVLF